MGKRGAEGRVFFCSEIRPCTSDRPTDVILRGVGEHLTLDLNSVKIEELSWKTHVLFQKWATASATVPQRAAHSSVSWGCWEQIYLKYWGSIWRLTVAWSVVFACSLTARVS